MVLAMLVEQYMDIPHFDMERGLLMQMLMPIIVPMAMEDIPMDLHMAMATGVGISMERGLLMQMLMPTTAAMAMAMEDMLMDPPMVMATDEDITMVNITHYYERTVMKS